MRTEVREKRLPGYQGPGLREWLLAFCATGLIASDLRLLLDRPQLQTAIGYYLEEPSVGLIHYAAIGLNVALLVLNAIWLFRGKPSLGGRISLATVCAASVSLVWFELLRALAPQTQPVYVLSTLPFFPINNGGLIGASVFLAYLAFLVPEGDLTKVGAFFLRTAFAICAIAAQSLVWLWVG